MNVNPSWRSVAWVAVAVLVCQMAAHAGFAQSGPLIYVMNADGTQLRKLAQVSGYRWLGWPQWSGDGKQIAFDGHPSASRTANDARIFSIPVEGGEAKELGLGRMPYWSPDGKQLVFFVPEGNSEDVRPGVWIMNGDGSGKQWVIDGQTGSFSPDGSRLVYIDRNQVFTHDIIEGTQHKVIDEAFQEITCAAWSPDGKRLALMGIRPGKTDSELSIVDLTATERQPTLRWTGAMSRHFNWAPGERILLGVTVNGRKRPHALDPDTQQEPVALENQDAGSLNNDSSWSPDRKQIAFSSNR